MSYSIIILHEEQYSRYTIPYCYIGGKIRQAVRGQKIINCKRTAKF